MDKKEILCPDCQWYTIDEHVRLTYACAAINNDGTVDFMADKDHALITLTEEDFKKLNKEFTRRHRK